MARDRAGKVGIDYFSHDTDMSLDIKIKLLKAKHGVFGYATYVMLLEELYRDKGYYLHLSEDFNILFCNENNIDYNVYILILNDCILKGLFNKDMYDKHNILTSNRIQLNYISATDRRKEVSFYKEYLLVDAIEKYKGKNVDVNILSLNANIGTQSKVDYIKQDKNNNMCAEDIYNYYLTKGLIDHKKFTDSMKKAIGKALQQDTVEELKMYIDRHKIVVDATRKKEKPVKKRGIDVFFGQKAYQAQHMIYEEYRDGGDKWLTYGSLPQGESSRTGAKKI